MRFIYYLNKLFSYKNSLIILNQTNCLQDMLVNGYPGEYNFITSKMNIVEVNNGGGGNQIETIIIADYIILWTQILASF